MLRQTALDNESFLQIADRARTRIADYFPEWNDLNVHDPGIMLVELLAWLTEAQRFHMDQSEHAAAFFPLLGITPRRVTPAYTYLVPSGAMATPIPPGTPIMAEEIWFETVEPILPTKPVTVVQRHTLCEDMDCGTVSAPVEPVTYLYKRGGHMLFIERDGFYTRIPMDENSGSMPASYEEGLQEDSKACLRMLSCEHSAEHSRFLGVANGFPSQRFMVATQGQYILREGFSLLIGSDKELSHCRRWTQVDDFRFSAPSDPHYVLEEEGMVSFGDGINGAMPKGVVFVASMSLCCGADGNIAAGQLTGLYDNGFKVAFTQPHPAEGGANSETTAQAFARYEAEKRQAVTAEDIERLVLETPGMCFAQARAFTKDALQQEGEPCRITIAIKPLGEEAGLFLEQKKAVREYLENYRLAGYEYEIVSPQYIGIRINIEVYAHRHDSFFSQLLDEELRRFFIASFDRFGACIRKKDMTAFLAGYLDIYKINVCELRTYSNHARLNANGDMYLSPDSLAYIEDLRVRVLDYSDFN